MRRAIALLCLLCLLCTGCPGPSVPPPASSESPSPAPSAVSVDPTLRWAVNEPTTLLPIDVTTPDDALVVGVLFDSLTFWDERLRPQPSVARRWQRFDRGRRWRFVLDGQAAFHDGRPVTAQDFVDTWSLLARDGAAHHHLRIVRGYEAVRRGRTRLLAGVEAVASDVLEVTLTRPLGDLPAVVAHPALAPMADAALDRRAQEEPVGNGAFRMAEPWARNRFVRMTRVRAAEPAAPAGGAPVTEVVFTFSDPVSAFIAYEQGGVDVATVPPGGMSAGVPPAEPRTRYRGPGLLRGELPTTYFLAFNTAQPPFDDRRTRRGISMAVDRRALIDRVFEGNASPGWSVTPPAVPGGRRRPCTSCAHDPVRARRLLRQAGVSTVTLWLNDGGDHEAVAAQVRADLASVGVTVRVRAVGFARFQRALRRGEAGMFRFGWSLDYPTADNALRPLFHSAAPTNHFGYRRRAVDEALDRAAAADPQTAAATYRRAEDLILRRDQAIVPLAMLRRRTVVGERVRNLVFGPMGTADLSRARIVDRDEG